MNNTELTLDQLLEVAGGTSDYTDYGRSSFMKRAVNHFDYRGISGDLGFHQQQYALRSENCFQKYVIKNFMLEVPMC